jgi:hypothetical protein
MAGQLSSPSLLVNVPRPVTAYYTERPDSSVPSQRVAFGTSGVLPIITKDCVSTSSNKSHELLALAWREDPRAWDAGLACLTEHDPLS